MELIVQDLAHIKILRDRCPVEILCVFWIQASGFRDNDIRVTRKEAGDPILARVNFRHLEYLSNGEGLLNLSYGGISPPVPFLRIHRAMIAERRDCLKHDLASGCGAPKGKLSYIKITEGVLTL